jgi:CheY-like chemotaxis protein
VFWRVEKPAPFADIESTRAFSGQRLVARAVRALSKSILIGYAIMKVLIVDNDRSALGLINGILESEGYETVLAGSAREATYKLETTRPLELIIVDIILAGPDSIEFLQYVKNNQRHRGIPILICSALDNPEIVVKCAALGVKDYVPKPVTREALIPKVKKLIASGEGLVLIVDDDNIVLDLLSRIVSREGYSVLTAPSGEEALAIMENNKIFALISDIVMPGISGIDLLKKTKSKCNETPVLLITGNSDKHSREEASAAGADGYIVKPFKNIEIARQLSAFRGLVRRPHQTTKRVVS